MRIALVSPYSWTYPGGVTRHIDALAQEFLAAGHHVRVLAPYDPPDRFAAVLHRGARPQTVLPPDLLAILADNLPRPHHQFVCLVFCSHSSIITFLKSNA